MNNDEIRQLLESSQWLADHDRELLREFYKYIMGSREWNQSNEEYAVERVDAFLRARRND